MRGKGSTDHFAHIRFINAAAIKYAKSWEELKNPATKKYPNRWELFSWILFLVTKIWTGLLYPAYFNIPEDLNRFLLSSALENARTTRKGVSLNYFGTTIFFKKKLSFTPLEVIEFSWVNILYLFLRIYLDFWIPFKLQQVTLLPFPLQNWTPAKLDWNHWNLRIWIDDRFLY